jgi:hypothetical protein
MGKETLDGRLMEELNFSGINSSLFAEGEVAGSSLGSEVKGGEGLL